MKLSLFPTLVAVLACSSANQLSAFTTSFPDPPFETDGMEVAGVAGWIINDPGSASGTGAFETMSFVSSLDGLTPAAALGGWNDIPDAAAPTTVFLSHAAPTSLASSSFSTQFAIARSATSQFPGRDGFGFSFRDSADNNLMTISLVPASSVDDDTYQVSYTIGTNPIMNAKDDDTGANMFIEQNGLYSLDFQFTPNGNNPLFTATLAGSVTQSFSGTATGLGAATIDRFGAEWNTIAGQEGDNHIRFDNVSLTPEPSSSLLIGLAAMAIAARRRRA